MMKCKHWDCPYKDCSYHQDSTGIYNDYLNFNIEKLPVWHPINDEYAESCFSYMDL